MGVERVLVRFVVFVVMAAAAAVDTSTESRALVVAYIYLVFPDPEYEFGEIAILELASARAFAPAAVVSAVWAVE
jgi:hypothetical protein